MNISVVRSKRRRKTIAAQLHGDTLVITAPAHLSDRELEPHIHKLQKRFTLSSKRIEDSLEERTQILNRKYFGGKLEVKSIKFVGNQTKRFGSCTTNKGTVRLSRRLLKTPVWVIDYVIIHELAHLLEPNHSKSFWDIVNKYPLAERARGYLIALSSISEID